MGRFPFEPQGREAPPASRIRGRRCAVFYDSAAVSSWRAAHRRGPDFYRDAARVLSVSAPAISGPLGHRAHPAAWSGSVAVASYLLYSLAPVVPGLQTWQKASAFYWYLASGRRLTLPKLYRPLRIA